MYVVDTPLLPRCFFTPCFPAFLPKYQYPLPLQVLVKDLLRKYPEWAESCVAVIGGVEHSNVSEREAKAALVWMLGEYGQDVSDAPYVLESIVEGWAEEESEAVRLEILTAVAKLFFKRPPECHRLLGRVLKLGTEDSNQVRGLGI